jgi:hypothetical protein
MKIKRDPESMKRVRETLAWRFPKLDALSDEELADAVDRCFTALEEWVPRMRDAMEDATKRMARVVRPLVDSVSAESRT